MGQFDLWLAAVSFLGCYEQTDYQFTSTPEAMWVGISHCARSVGTPRTA